MISLKEFKEKNCSGCYYNGSLGMLKKVSKLMFCAFRGDLIIDVGRGICHSKTTEKNSSMLRG